jgi:hypothetical protein
MYLRRVIVNFFSGASLLKKVDKFFPLAYSKNMRNTTTTFISESKVKNETVGVPNSPDYSKEAIEAKEARDEKIINIGTKIFAIFGLFAALALLSIAIVRFVPMIAGAISSATISHSVSDNNTSTDLSSVNSNNPSSVGGNNDANSGYLITTASSTNNLLNSNSFTTNNSSNRSSTAISAGQPSTKNYNVNIVQNIPGNSPTPKNYNGAGSYVDLTARIIDTGIINPSTGVYTPASIVNPTDRGGVRFEIINIGTKTSGNWTFAAVLPTFPPYTFQSDEQAPLAPGDRMQFTLGFDSIIRQATSTIIINADPLGEVNEIDKANNIAKGLFYVNVN